MFYMYILQSTLDQELYIGSTNNLRRRFAEHNAGESFSTRLRRPFSIVYYEAYISEKDARQREHNLKLRGRARRQLMLRIKDSLAS